MALGKDSYSVQYIAHVLRNITLAAETRAPTALPEVMGPWRTARLNTARTL